MAVDEESLPPRLIFAWNIALPSPFACLLTARTEDGTGGWLIVLSAKLEGNQWATRKSREADDRLPSNKGTNGWSGMKGMHGERVAKMEIMMWLIRHPKNSEIIARCFYEMKFQWWWNNWRKKTINTRFASWTTLFNNVWQFRIRSDRERWREYETLGIVVIKFLSTVVCQIMAGL